MILRCYAVALVCSLVLVAVPSMAGTAMEALDEIGDQTKMLLMKEILRVSDVDISFFGKVVDQNNNPVEGANIEIQVSQFSPDVEELFGQTKSITVQTDLAGRFSVEKERGRSIYVKTIAKSGYDGALLTGRTLSFQYAKDGDRNPFVPNRTAPIVFTMRRKGETTFCVETRYCECQILACESGKTKGFDFIEQKQVQDATSVACDLRVKATFSTNDATWTVVFSSGYTNGGIIVSEQLLHVAPDAGYQPEYTFVPEDIRPVKAKYVYLRSRNPSIYTRFETAGFNASKKQFRLNGRQAIANPYGDRNLEEATDLPYVVKEQLREDAKASFRQNKRPLKPDLPKLIKDAEARANKAKSKQ